MGSKKKKRAKKARKKRNEKLQNTPVKDLISRGTALIDSDKPREAIQVLKAALKSDQGNETIKPLLFQSYLFREKQLCSKGMCREAELLHKQTLLYRPEPSHLTLENLAAYVEIAPLNEAVSTYSRYIAFHKPSRKAEEIITGRMLSAQKWNLLQNLPASSPLKTHAPLLESAVKLMNSGKWEEAFSQLQSVSRNSPLAPVKLLCRVMQCFYAQDDPGMNRALSMLPANVPPYSSVQRLHQSPESVACLWEERFVRKQDIETLIDHIKKMNIAFAVKKIKNLALKRYPKNPQEVMVQIMDDLWLLMVTEGIFSEDFDSLIFKMLPSNLAETVSARYDYLEFKSGIEDTIKYLESLKTEFADEEDHRIASSMVLSEAVELLKTEDFSLKDVEFVDSDKQKLLGTFSADQDLALIEMLTKALDLDSENKQAYKHLSNLPRPSRQAKNLVEGGLKQMTEIFPEDPAPYLALAELYYEKNAFRKAENILKKALSIAPYDPKVRDRHVLSLLISAEKALRRNKIHLAKQDLESANKLCSQQLGSIVTEKRILFEIEELGQLSLFDDEINTAIKNIPAIIERHLLPLPVEQRLKTIGMLILDVQNKGAVWDKAKKKQLDSAFRKQAKNLKKLDSKTISHLLLPLGDEMLPVIPKRHMAGVFLARQKKVLELIADQDILPVIDALLDEKKVKHAEKEINRRLKKHSDQFYHLFKFYQVTLNHLTGKFVVDVDAFEMVIDGLEGNEREKLRAASRRLSKYARGNLQLALKKFDFNFLEPEFAGPLFLEDDLENDPFPSPQDLLNFPDLPLLDDFEELINPHVYIINQIETLLDEIGIRGAPASAVRKLKKELVKTDRSIKTLFNEAAEAIDDNERQTLSREMRILLYDKA